MEQTNKQTLYAMEQSIKREIPYVGIKPYSHNIISITLRAIAEEYGDEEAEYIVATTELKNMGWGYILKKDHKELYKRVMYELKLLKDECGYSDTIITDWRIAQQEPLSAPVYNEEEDEMELKVWCSNHSFKEHIKNMLNRFS
tara:strand:- start:54 stop:482 length:429 start_codon:yes stop_codon:yes gene_type:complete